LMTKSSKARISPASVRWTNMASLSGEGGAEWSSEEVMQRV
jgi:hypothetical protein